MLWRTHVLAGASAGLLIAGNHAELKTVVMSVGVAGFAALLPDLDSQHSKLGAKVPILPKLLTITVGHRGLLHSILGAVIVSFLIGLVVQMFLAYPFKGLILLILAGYISHIVIDTFTNNGCPLLWPLPVHIKLPLVSTGSLMEKLVVFPAVGVFFIWLAWPILHRWTSHVLRVISSCNMY